MNQLFRTRPHFIEIINKQILAYFRLNNDKTTRTPTERLHMERSLQAVPLSDVESHKVPLVRLKNEKDDRRWVVLGEIAQSPMKMILLDVKDGTINLTLTSEDLELVSPIDLT